MGHIRDEETERSVVRWNRRLEELPRNAGAVVRGGCRRTDEVDEEDSWWPYF